MGTRRVRRVWVHALLALCAAPFVLTVSPAEAQTKGTKNDPCDPSYVPKKGETPLTCPGVKTLVVEPAQGPTSHAATPPPVRTPTQIRRNTDKRAVVDSPGFRMSRDGASRIFLQVHGTPTIQQYATRGGVTYVLTNCRVPVSNNRHALMTQYFNTPVADAVLRQVRKDVQLRIDLRAPTVPSPRLIELVPGKTVMLEITFPPGDYRQHIPTTSPRRRKRSPSYSGSTPSAPRGSRSSPPPSDGARSSVLGPAAP